MDVLNIIMREAKDSSNIYLYEEDGCWCAYEQSAIMISKLLKEAVIVTDYALDNCLILNKVKITLDNLIGLNITSCSDHELVVS